MRRSAALVMAGIFSFLLIAPAFTVGTDSSVPACCRRDGKHHCSSTTEWSGDGPAAVAAKCSSFPQGGTLAPQSGSALPAGDRPVFVAMVQYPTVQAQAEAGYRVSIGRSHLKRGPPSLAS